MTDRQIVVVDCETSGLLTSDVIVEVAWWNLATGDHDVFVPAHDEQWVLEHGDQRALEINGYRDRLAGAEQDEGYGAAKLIDQLHGNTFAGSNPTFDAGHIERRYDHKVWHHRLLDLANYAAPLLGLLGHELPGLATVCERLGVENPAPHTALGDVQATAECFRLLFDRVKVPAGEAHQR